jgi:protein TonB
MSSATPVLPPPATVATAPPRLSPSHEGRPPSDFKFHSLVVTEPESLVRGRSTTVVFSALLHTVLAVAVVVLPLLWTDVLPSPDTALRAFFAAPREVAPPPPPPPPPAGARAPVRRIAPPARPVEPAAFIAPIEVPTEIKPEENVGTDLGVEGGVPGGVEGGVPGGVVGGIIGGLPKEPPPAPKAVRIGGLIIAPKVLHRVAPEYPRLATTARVRAEVLVEALVDVHGVVQRVTVVRGHPLFDEAALTAVKQWRYKPLLLNGEPTPFILTVTITFRLQQPAEIQ